MVKYWCDDIITWSGWSVGKGSLRTDNDDQEEFREVESFVCFIYVIYIFGFSLTQSVESEWIIIK